MNARHILLVITLLIFAACDDGPGKSDSGPDADTDTDTDTDSDTDADTDSDSDTDNDTDSDTETDTDTDTNGNLIWVKSAGGSSLDYGNGISALSDGSSIVLGRFIGTATFGAGETNETILTSDGEEDIFAAKYNADGTLDWAKRAGGNGIDWSFGGISTLFDGSFLMTGSFEGTAVFGFGDLGETLLTSDGLFEVVVAKYNADGTLDWAKRAGGSESDLGRDICTLVDGSALVTGEFRGTATFGAGETNETALTSSGNNDIFVARYNADGTLAWAKRAGGSGEGRGISIVALADGSAMVAGYFGNIATFGVGESNETALTSAGSDDLFVARYGVDGTLEWARRAGGSGSDQNQGIFALADGSFLVVGNFSDAATFGAGETNETILTSDGEEDIFAAKYNADGTLEWAKRAGGTGMDYGLDIAALADNSALFSGSFRDTATFGPGEANETALTSDGYSDAFFGKLNTDGTLAWVKRAGGSANDSCNDLVALTDDSVLVTGYFMATGTFGPGEPNEAALTSDGDRDVFVAKFGP